MTLYAEIKLEKALEYAFNMEQGGDQTFECLDCMAEFDEEDDLTYGFCSKCLKKSYTEANFRKYIEAFDLADEYKEFLDGDADSLELLEMFCTDDLSHYCEWLATQI